MPSDNDVIGEALLAYYKHNDKTDIIVKSSITEDDIIPTKYLFRTLAEMPKIEQKAIEFCFGSVLDVGAASGCHSLVLKEKCKNVTAIDISQGAVDLMNDRGISAQKLNFFEVKEKYDTLLFLMNGVGIAGTLKELPKFLNHSKSLLKPNGQILLDSSDISYLFKEDDGSQWVNLNKNYYGEVSYRMTYKNYSTNWFDWLFIDFNTLQEQASKVGLKCELIQKGSHYDYLARLSIL